MKTGPYGKFKSEELILRDYLAIDRTILANERTFLAYMRTALTLIVAGLSFVHFLSGTTMLVVGGIFIPLGLFTFGFGIMRYREFKKQIGALLEREEDKKG